MIGYLRLELARTLRDGRYLVLAVMAPVGFYLLFAAVFGGRSHDSSATFGLSAAVEIMVAMATFGAMWGALSATAPRLARDRETGWLAFLDTTPLSSARVLGARIAAGLLVALPAILAVGITAALTHGVQLAGWQWAAGLGLLWLGTTPFVALGIAIGSLTSSTVAYALSTALYFALAALGGLWVPPSVLPASLRELATVLPSYNQAALGWHVAAGSSPTLSNALVLSGWTAALTAIPFAVHHLTRRTPGGNAPSATGGRYAIELSDITKRFGSVTAASHVDLQIAPGAIVALLGPNGAGKTTIIAILLGLAQPDAGSARLLGSAPRQPTRAGDVGVMLQDTELMAGVRVGELLRFQRAMHLRPTELSALIHGADLSELLGCRTDRLSAGQAQRVRFALAVAGDPRLLILDEPTAAMDFAARQAFWTAVRDRTARGTTVLFSTHNLQEADEHADRIALIRQGQIVADGTPEQVKTIGGASRVVRFRLLGGSAQQLRRLAGVTAVHADDRRVTLHTTNADATVWALYELRSRVTDLEVTAGDLQDAFLNLTSPQSNARAPGPTALA